MAQVYEYNSEKKAFQVIYNFEMHDSLPPCSELKKIFKTHRLPYACCATR